MNVLHNTALKERDSRNFHQLMNAGLAISPIMKPEVQRELDQLGRTEDIRFSPSGKRMAIVAHLRNCITLFDIEISNSKKATPVVEISDFLEISSKKLAAPHGIVFIDENTIAVANRQGLLTIFEIPKVRGKERRLKLAPSRSFYLAGRFTKIHSPGSLTLLSKTDALVELLVCNNYRNRITRHTYRLAWPWLPGKSEIVLEEELNVPDGICVSNNRRWLAVSNHMTSTIYIYDLNKPLLRKRKPDGYLRGMHCPHGILFSRDDNYLFGADAATRFLASFKGDPDDWYGSRELIDKLIVVEEEDFESINRHDPFDGGSKGLDIDPEQKIMVITTEDQQLLCLDYSKYLGRLTSKYSLRE